MSDFENDASAPKGVSRRTVAKAMAWSVPVVAVAVDVTHLARMQKLHPHILGTMSSLPNDRTADEPVGAPYEVRRVVDSTSGTAGQ